MQNQSETLERCETGRIVDKRPPQRGRPIDDWLSDPQRQPKRSKAPADDAIEMAIERLDWLGSWLNDWRLQPLIEKAIRGTLDSIASKPISDPSSKQLGAYLIEAWNAVGNWLECGSRIDECTLCFAHVAQTVHACPVQIYSSPQQA